MLLQLVSKGVQRKKIPTVSSMPVEMIELIQSRLERNDVPDVLPLRLDDFLQELHIRGLITPIDSQVLYAMRRNRCPTTQIFRIAETARQLGQVTQLRPVCSNSSLLEDMFVFSDNFFRPHVTGSRTYVSFVIPDQVTRLFLQCDSTFALISFAMLFTRACMPRKRTTVFIIAIRHTKLAGMDMSLR